MAHLRVVSSKLTSEAELRTTRALFSQLLSTDIVSYARTSTGVVTLTERSFPSPFRRRRLQRKKTVQGCRRPRQAFRRTPPSTNEAQRIPVRFCQKRGWRCSSGRQASINRGRVQPLSILLNPGIISTEATVSELAEVARGGIDACARRKSKALRHTGKVSLCTTQLLMMISPQCERPADKACTESSAVNPKARTRNSGQLPLSEGRHTPARAHGRYQLPRESRRAEPLRLVGIEA